MTATKAAIMAMAIGLSTACVADDSAPLDGGWRVSADISPCVFSARIPIAFEIDGEELILVNAEVGGDPVTAVDFEADTVRIWTETAEWSLVIADDGEDATALVGYANDAGCVVEPRPATVERER